jgi:hypothetical protein
MISVWWVLRTLRRYARSQKRRTRVRGDRKSCGERRAFLTLRNQIDGGWSLELRGSRTDARWISVWLFVAFGGSDQLYAEGPAEPGIRISIQGKCELDDTTTLNTH